MKRPRISSRFSKWYRRVIDVLFAAWVLSLMVKLAHEHWWLPLVYIAAAAAIVALFVVWVDWAFRRKQRKRRARREPRLESANGKCSLGCKLPAGHRGDHDYDPDWPYVVVVNGERYVKASALVDAAVRARGSEGS